MSADEVTKEINLKLSASALTGLILGIIGILLSAVPIINNFAAILGLAALVLGIVGIVGTKKGKRRGKGMAIAAVILAVLTLIIVFASQALYSSAINSASEEFNKSMDKATGEATSEILGKDLDVTLGTFSAVEGEYGLVTTKLPVKVSNKLSEAKSFTIKVEAVNAEGTRVAEDTVYVDKLGAGQSQELEAFKYVESGKVDALKTATFKVATVSEM